MPSSSSPEPTIGYIEDLDFFKDFDNEFPAIAYNDLKSKSYPINKPPISSQQIDMAPLPHCNLRHPWLRYQVNGYDEGDRLSMMYTRDDGQALFTSHAWRRLFEVRASLVREFMLELFSTCRMSDTEMGLDEEMVEGGFGAYWSGSMRVIPDKGDLRDYLMKISFDREFLGLATSYVHIRDPGWKNGARFFGGHFIGCLATHSGLVGDQGLRSLSVVVALGPKRQHATAVGAPGAAEDAPIADKGAQASPTPMQAPQPSPPAPQPRTMSQRIDWLEEEVRELRQSVVSLRGFFESYITKKARVFTWMISCMMQLMDASGRTYQAFNSTLIGSSRLSYQRRVRPRTDDAGNSTAPHTNP
nr:hypothetical protein [Tanacetum cinerariifolium]